MNIQYFLLDNLHLYVQIASYEFCQKCNVSVKLQTL